jgi:transposase
MQLTKEQKLKLLNLYFGGVTKYTDLAKLTGYSYNSVNSFMTRWKRKSGLLKTRKHRNKYKNLAILPTDSITITKDELEELQALRRFFRDYVLNNPKKPA